MTGALCLASLALVVLPGCSVVASGHGAVRTPSTAASAHGASPSKTGAVEPGDTVDLADLGQRVDLAVQAARGGSFMITSRPFLATGRFTSDSGEVAADATGDWVGVHFRLTPDDAWVSGPPAVPARPTWAHFDADSDPSAMTDRLGAALDDLDLAADPAGLVPALSGVTATVVTRVDTRTAYSLRLDADQLDRAAALGLTQLLPGDADGGPVAVVVTLDEANLPTTIDVQRGGDDVMVQYAAWGTQDLGPVPSGPDTSPSPSGSRV